MEHAVSSGRDGLVQTQRAALAHRGRPVIPLRQHEARPNSAQVIRQRILLER